MSIKKSPQEHSTSGRVDRVSSGIMLFLFVTALCLGGIYFYRYFNQTKVLKQIIERLSADSRIAEVVVTDVHLDPVTKKNLTTIKFLEFDSRGRPLAPKSFTFSGNLIQFQSLVARFDDQYIKNADRLKGRSIYLFWKAFVLKGKETEEYIITPTHSVPAGYQLENATNPFEEKIWNEFWDYALDPDQAQRLGIKNAQIEAPGTKFVPGKLYTLKIEHDGGIRIDVQKIPEILNTQKINP